MQPMTDRPITALVVGTDEWATNQAAAAVRAAGIRALRCHEPGEAAFPCNAFVPGRVCPLDVGFDVVLTTRARPSQTTEPGEIGVVCGLRAGRPLVVAGVIANNPFQELATKVVKEGGDTVQACLLAAGTAHEDRVELTEAVDLRAVRR
jgi:hypothetical protein